MRNYLSGHKRNTFIGSTLWWKRPNLSYIKATGLYFNNTKCIQFSKKRSFSRVVLKALWIFMFYVCMYPLLRLEYLGPENTREHPEDWTRKGTTWWGGTYCTFQSKKMKAKDKENWYLQTTNNRAGQAHQGRSSKINQR